MGATTSTTAPAGAATTSGAAGGRAAFIGSAGVDGSRVTAAAAAAIRDFACGASGGGPSYVPPLIRAPVHGPGGRVISTGRPVPFYGTSTYIELCPLLARSTSPMGPRVGASCAQTHVATGGRTPAPAGVAHLVGAVPGARPPSQRVLRAQVGGVGVRPKVAGAVGPRRACAPLLDAVLGLVTRPRVTDDAWFALRAWLLGRQRAALVPAKKATAPAPPPGPRTRTAGAVAATTEVGTRPPADAPHA